MGTARVVALVLALLSPTAAVALTPTPTAPPEACTPRPDPLRFAIQIEPAMPRVGDDVLVTVRISEVSGLLFGNASVALQGAAPLFGRNPPIFLQPGTFGGTATFMLHAEVGGTAELSVSVNYETECDCPPVCFYRRTVVSPPFVVSVIGPTATPQPVCTPPPCGEGEVFACPDACPGGCGTICATRTPTPCAIPACQNDEVFVCTGDCPNGCGLACATRTQTPIPIPSCPGDCNDDGRVEVGELVRGVRVALLGVNGDQQCLVAFDRAGTGALGIDDLLRALNSALVGCQEQPSEQALRFAPTMWRHARHHGADRMGGS